MQWDSQGVALFSLVRRLLEILTGRLLQSVSSITLNMAGIQLDFQQLATCISVPLTPGFTKCSLRNVCTEFPLFGKDNISLY